MKKRDIIILAVVLLIIVSFVVKLRISGFVVTSINTCYDTDLGKEYGKKGLVSGEYYLFLKEEYREEDYCKGDILVEYYCVQDGIHTHKEKAEYICSNGCLDGFCIGEVVELPRKKSLFFKLKEFFSFFSA